MAPKQATVRPGEGGERSRPRRAPVQKRSIAKVRRILDAAQQLSEKGGLSELTTNAIADRAGIPVSTLYEYFPDRDAVLTAVLARYVESFAQILRRVFDDPAPQDWGAASDAVVDAFADYYRTEPGFRALWFGGYRDEDLVELDRANLVVLADLWQSLLQEHGLIARHPDADLPFLICWELGDRLLDLAFRRSPDGDEAVLAEAKIILRDYAGRYHEGG